MAIRPETARKFDGSSAVARYWLAQCEGFRVKGPTRGTVERVLGSVDPQHAEALVVRTVWGRREVPVGAVDVVVPANRLIVVAKPRKEAAPAPARRRTRAIADSAPRVARFIRNAAVACAVLVAAGMATVVRAVLVFAVGVARFAMAVSARIGAEIQAQRALAERRRRGAAPARTRQRTRV
jgi:hypothetical protein